MKRQKMRVPGVVAMVSINTGHRDGEHRRRDEPLASEYVSGRAGERCCQRNREGACRDHGADLCSRDPELARELRQQGLRRVKVEESGESRGGDGKPPKINGHAA